MSNTNKNKKINGNESKEEIRSEDEVEDLPHDDLSDNSQSEENLISKPILSENSTIEPEIIEFQ